MTTSPKPVDATADAWHVLRNRTFDEIAIGDSASLERAFSSQDIHMFALQSGDVDPEPAVSSSARGTTEAICANALISAVLSTRLPGPGTRYVNQNLCFLGAVRPGDRLTVRMQVTSKDTANHHVTLACTCTNQEGVAVFQGQVEVVAPTERLERTRTVLPEIHPNAQGRTGLQSLLAHVAHLQPIRVAVAHPCDAPSLSAALEARHAGLIEPVLVGPRARLEAVATEAGLDLADVAIVDAPHSHAAAQQAVALAAKVKSKP
jgi:acyl dehydratase